MHEKRIVLHAFTERPLEVALNILYGTDEIEYVVERSDISDHPGESDVCDCHRHNGVITD